MTPIHAHCKSCGHPISARSPLALLQAMAAHNDTAHDTLVVWAVGTR